MKLRRHCQLAKGPFDLAPVLNLFALLLFFFLLSSAVMITPGTSIELPTSHAAMIGAEPSLVITVARDRSIFFRDQFYTREQLPKLRDDLAAAVKQLGRKSLTVKADKTVSYDFLMQLSDAAASAGLEKVNLAARFAAPEKP